MKAAQRVSENIREEESLLEEQQPLYLKRRWSGAIILAMIIDRRVVA